MTRITRRPTLLTTLALAALLGACGDGEKKSAAPGPQSGDLTPGLDCSKAKDSGKKPAGKSSTRLFLADADLRHVPADTLRFAAKDGDKTLCDTLRGTGAKLALVSLTTIRCYDCMQRAEAVSKAVEDLGLEDDVLPVVILTDREGDLTVAEWKELQAAVAPDAVWGFDRYTQLYNFFVDETTKPMKPLLLAMDVHGTAFLDDDAERDVQSVIEEASRRMDLGLGDAAEDEEDEDEDEEETSTFTSTSTDTDTETETSTETSTQTSTETATAL